MIHRGDCLEVMAAMEPESVDAVVTDPPYGLEFMGKEWDKLLMTPQGGAAWARGNHGGLKRPSMSQSRGEKCDICGSWKGGATAQGAKCECPAPKFRNVSRGPEQQAFHARWAEAAYRVAKPSAYLLAFGGTRTVHRMTVALEDAGWIIRDMLVWAYLSGFPKSRASLKPSWEPIVLARKPGPLRELNIEDCRIGDEQAWRYPNGPKGNTEYSTIYGGGEGLPRMEQPREGPLGRWPANIVMTEPVFGDASRIFQVGRSGMPSGTMGTCQTCGAPIAEQPSTARTQPLDTAPPSAATPLSASPELLASDAASPSPSPETATAPRPAPIWPGGTLGSISPPTASPSTSASAMPSSSDDAGTTLRTPRSKPLGTLLESEPPSSPAKSPDVASPETGITTTTPDRLTCDTCADPTTSATTSRSRVPADDPDHPRFLIIPKADRSDREPVLGGLPLRDAPKFDGGDFVNPAWDSDSKRTQRANHHPTVKPTELMRHLVRLVTPAGGTVLDPFLGSGTTGLACELEGFPWIGIEKEAEYVAIAEARLNGTQRGLGLAG
jgi:DNA modification methylase